MNSTLTSILNSSVLRPCNLRVWIVSFATLMCGCGGGNDTVFGNGGKTVVDEIRVDDDPIPLARGSVVRVNFSFDNNDVLTDKGNVRLVVHLPKELDLRGDNAEIDGPTGNDKKVGAQILRCPDSGETYLFFDMDRFDLQNAEDPDSSSDAQLKFTVDASQVGRQLVIEAAADEEQVAYGCNVTFLPDEQQLTSVE